MSNKSVPSTLTPEELAIARQQFEAEKLTRRAALKKFGITSGMAVFSMFAADDLARMVLKQMEQNEATRQIAETVAHEFKNSGIAFAGPPPPGCDDSPPGSGICNIAAIGRACASAHPNDTVSCSRCVLENCYRCACDNSRGVPCKNPACSTYCHSTAIGYCSMD